MKSQVKCLYQGLSERNREGARGRQISESVGKIDQVRGNEAMYIETGQRCVYHVEGTFCGRVGLCAVGALAVISVYGAKWSG